MLYLQEWTNTCIGTRVLLWYYVVFYEMQCNASAGNVLKCNARAGPRKGEPAEWRALFSHHSLAQYFNTGHNHASGNEPPKHHSPKQHPYTRIQTRLFDAL